MEIERLPLIFTDSDDEQTGVDLEARTLADETNNAVLFVNRPFRRNGYLSRVRYYAVLSESFVIGVWRTTGTAKKYSLVGRSYVTSSGQDKVIIDLAPVHVCRAKNQKL